MSESFDFLRRRAAEQQLEELELLEMLAEATRIKDEYHRRMNALREQGATRRPLKETARRAAQRIREDATRIIDNLDVEIDWGESVTRCQTEVDAACLLLDELIKIVKLPRDGEELSQP